MAEKQGELFPEDKKPKSTKNKRRKSLNLPLEERVKLKKQREQQADVVDKEQKFRESEREYWKKKNEEDSSNLKIQSGPDYAKDSKQNQTGDQILDPEGNFPKGKYVKPTLEQLKRRAALGISTAGQVVRSANPTGMVLPLITGAGSLLIKNMQQQLMGVN